MRQFNLACVPKSIPFPDGIIPLMENGLNQHYATLLGLGEEWRVATPRHDAVRDADSCEDAAREVREAQGQGHGAAVGDEELAFHAPVLLRQVRHAPGLRARRRVLQRKDAATHRAIPSQQAKSVSGEWGRRSYAHSAKRECAEAKRRAGAEGTAKPPARSRARAPRLGVHHAARGNSSTLKTSMNRN